MHNCIHADLAKRLEGVVRQLAFAKAANGHELSMQMPPKNSLQARSGIDYIIAYLLVVIDWRVKVVPLISDELNISPWHILAGVEARYQHP